MKATFITTLFIGLIWRTTFLLIRPEDLDISYVIPIGQLDSWSIGGLVALNIKEKGNNAKLLLSEISIGLIGIIVLIAYNAYVHNTSILGGYLLFKSATGYMTNPFTGNIHFFIAVLSAGLLRYCLYDRWQHPILSSAPVVAFGGMTYEFYCFHFPIKVVIFRYIHNQWLFLLFTLIATYLFSLIWLRWATPIIKKVIH